MRSPRVVGDYHVDRREVQVQRCTEPTRTNSPITFVSSFRSSLSRHTGSRLWGSGNTKRRRRGVGEQAAAAFGGRRRTGVWLLPAAAAPSFFARPVLPHSFLPISRPSSFPSSSSPPLPRPWPPSRPPPARERSSNLPAACEPSRPSLRPREKIF